MSHWSSSSKSLSLSLHCQATNQAAHPVSQPTTTLSKFQSLSGICSKTSLIAFKTEVLGVFIPKFGAPRTFWNAKLTASSYFLRILPSCSKSGWCREPLHHPLNNARDFKVTLQGFQYYCLLQRNDLLRHPHVLVKSVVTYPIDSFHNRPFLEVL